MKKYSFWISVLLACCWVISLSGLAILQSDCVDNDRSGTYGEPTNPVNLCSKRYGYTWFQIFFMFFVAGAGIVISSSPSRYAFWKQSLQGLTAMVALLYFNLSSSWFDVMTAYSPFLEYNGFRLMVAGGIACSTVASMLVITLGMPDGGDASGNHVKPLGV